MKWIPSGDKDVFIEVAERYKSFILRGVYKDGDPLPSVRAAATDLDVNPNTVQKAYARLEEEGLIVVLPKKGAFVRAALPPQTEIDRRSVILDLKNQGVTKELLLKWIGEVYRDD